MLGEKLERIITRKALLSEDIEIPISQREHLHESIYIPKGSNTVCKTIFTTRQLIAFVLIKSNCLLIIPPGSSSNFKDQIVDIIDF